MLHILWMLIKFILILLGILLGLVLLAVLLVLFCPIRYKVDGHKQSENWKEVTANVSVSWLFHGIWLKMKFRDGALKKDLRIFGVSFFQVRERLKAFKKKRKKKKAAAVSRANVEKSTKVVESKTKESKTTVSGTGEANASDRNTSESKLKNEVKVPETKLQETKLQETELPEAGKSTVGNEPADSSNKKNLSAKIKNIIGKIRDTLKKIPEIFRKILLTIRRIYDNIEWWKAFLSHPKVQAAIDLVKDDLVKLLKHIFPTRIKGHVTYGSEDPSITGTVLAVLGMTMPFHKNKIEVTPVFDGSDVFVGDVTLKGRIYGVVLIKAALEIYFNKNIKYSINRWKHKED